MNKTNWLAVVAAVVAGMGLGYLWYGALFMKQWADGNGITTNDDMTQMFKYGEEVAMSNTPMIVNTIGLIVFAILLNWLMNKTNHITAASGAKLGAIIGLFAAINLILGGFFAVRPLSLGFVDGSYIIVLLAVMGLILGAWRKK